jgi:hypothetical protein
MGPVSSSSARSDFEAASSESCAKLARLIKKAVELLEGLRGVVWVGMSGWSASEWLRSTGEGTRQTKVGKPWLEQRYPGPRGNASIIRAVCFS